MIMKKGELYTTHRRTGQPIHVNFQFIKEPFPGGRFVYHLQIKKTPFADPIRPDALLYSQDRYLLQDMKQRIRTFLEFATPAELKELDTNFYGVSQIIGTIEGSGKKWR